MEFIVCCTHHNIFIVTFVIVFKGGLLSNFSIICLKLCWKEHYKTKNFYYLYIISISLFISNISRSQDCSVSVKRHIDTYGNKSDVHTHNCIYKRKCTGWVNVCLVFFAGSVFSKTEMSEVLTEICKSDPTFNKEDFIRLCEREIIPNILEVHSALCWYGFTA